MKDEATQRCTQRWSQFRFSVIGPLLASPPARGTLWEELTKLAAKTWKHPVDGGPIQPTAKTIEGWYYQARDERDPVSALRRKRRSDGGKKKAIAPALAEALRAQVTAPPTVLAPASRPPRASICSRPAPSAAITLRSPRPITSLWDASRQVADYARRQGMPLHEGSRVARPEPRIRGGGNRGLTGLVRLTSRSTSEPEPSRR